MRSRSSCATTRCRWGTLAAHGWDRIVVSPGPGRPERERDLGVGRAALAQREIPVLGVCLGHQGLAHVGGANVVRGERIVHGRISTVFHSADGLFAAIPQGFRAVRYHSLVVEPALPPELEALAWADDGTLMAIARPPAPGVGRAVSSRVDRHRARRAADRELHRDVLATPPAGGACRGPAAQHGRARRPDAGAQQRRGADRPPRARRRARRRARLRRAVRRPRGRVLAGLEPRRPGAVALLLPGRGARRARRRGPLRASPTGRSRSRSGGARASRRRRRCSTTSAASSRACTPTAPSCRSHLNGGFVGYLGYECKADCGAADAHAAELPDAFLLLADRLLVIDHALERTHLLALSDGDAGRARLAAQTWLDATAARLDDLPALAEPAALEHERGRAAVHPAPRARALPREHRDLQAAARVRRELRDLPHQPARAARDRRPVRALPRAAARQPGALQRLPAPARGRDPELVARALPARRARPHGRGQADQGHRAPVAPSRPPTAPRATRSRAARRTAPSTS